jgi:hypothetical protein
MKYTVLTLLMIIALSLSTASASYTYDQVQNYVGQYDARIDNAPEPVKSLMTGLLGSERIDLNISMDDGSIFSVGFETKEARVSNISMGGFQNPTIIMTATDGAIERIKVSDDPVATFQEEMKYGQVTVEGTNPFTSLKLSAVLSSLPVMKFFSSIFFG